MVSKASYLLVWIVFLHIDDLLAAGSAPNLETLRFVHVVWRHGDRNPSDGVFPTDIYNQEPTWPQGFGELTPLGVLNHYQLGRWLKRRYKGFVREKYNAKEIYIRSSNYNRTLSSAYANMAGFYGNWSILTSHSVPNLANRSWYPVPVHTIDKPNDYLLWMNCPCPEADKLKAATDASEEFQRFLNENKNIFDYFCSNSGRPIKTGYDIWKMFDPLNCEYDHLEAHVPPAWINATLFRQFSDLYDYSLKFLFNTLAWQKLRGGPLLVEIVDRMDTLLGPNRTTFNSDLKYYAYSAHDDTLTALMQCLDNSFNIRGPPYASAMLFELHQVGEEHFVEIFYHNTTMTNSSIAPPPHPILVPACGHPCSLRRLVRISRRFIIEDWFHDCGLKSGLSAWKVTAIVFIVLTAVFFVIVAILLFLVVRQRNSGNKYAIVPADDSSTEEA